MRTVLVVFGELTDQDMDWLTANGAKQSLKKGDILIKKDSPIHALYIVLNGEFGVWVTEQREVSRAVTGEILGEMSLIEARPPGATVKAAVNSDVLAIPRPKLEDKLRSDTAFAARFYKALAVLLSFRLRRQTMGKDDTNDERDELDENLLDTVFLAGARFDRMVKRFA